MTSVGAPTNHDELLDGVATLLAENNRLDELSGMIWHPDIWKTYVKLKTGISGMKKTWNCLLVLRMDVLLVCPWQCHDDVSSSKHGRLCCYLCSEVLLIKYGCPSCPFLFP